MSPTPDDEDDVRLFREAVSDVKRLPRREALPVTSRRRPVPVARFSRADRHAVLLESLDGETGDPELAAGDELVYHRDGVQISILRKLRRGQYRVQAEIDLHGLTVAEAKVVLLVGQLGVVGPGNPPPLTKVPPAAVPPLAPGKVLA